MQTSEKTQFTAYILTFFLGWLGIHRFYMKRKIYGSFIVILMVAATFCTITIHNDTYPIKKEYKTKTRELYNELMTKASQPGISNEDGAKYMQDYTIKAQELAAEHQYNLNAKTSGLDHTAMNAIIILYSLILSFEFLLVGCGILKDNKGLKLKPCDKYDTGKKSQAVAYLLCYFLGVIGLHRFYVGKASSGLLMPICFLIGVMFIFISPLNGVFLILFYALWVFFDLTVIGVGRFKDVNGYLLK